MAGDRGLSARTLWLIAAALLVALFALDAWAVTAGLIETFDQRTLAWLRDPEDARRLTVPGWTLTVAIAVTELGGWKVRVPVAVGAVLWFRHGRRHREALVFALSVASAVIALPLLKDLFARARPDLMWQLVAERHPSFPSGHAMGAALSYPLLGLLARRRAAVIGGILLAVLIGLSRAFLGVHWASDVIGGWLIGAAWLCATLALLSEDGRQTAR